MATSEHVFKYSPRAAMQVALVQDVIDGITITVPGGIKVAKPFQARVVLPEIEPLNILPTGAANQFKSSVLLQAIAFKTDLIGNVTQATKMVVGYPTRVPRRRRKSLRLLPRQFFKFRKNHGFVNTDKVIIVIRTVHSYFDDAGGGVAYTNRKMIVKASAPETVTP